MALTADILETYRRPARVVRRHLEGGPREDRALVFVMLACLLMFVAQWPRLSREAAITPEASFQMYLGGALLGWVFIMPLVLYGVAAASHLVARLFGGRGSFASARMALFWAFLAATPLWLVQGLLQGFAGGSGATTLTGALALAGFAVFWIAGLREAQRRPIEAAQEQT